MKVITGVMGNMYLNLTTACYCSLENQLEDSAVETLQFLVKRKFF